jgi:carbonic anhydrase
MDIVPSSEQALTRLIFGNQRYVAGNPAHPNQSPDHRLALSNGQKPFAAILGCADSRVPPSIIFDQGLGDLFIIRVAGNIVDNSVLASLEFAVVQLQVPLIMVLGHAECGAVQATIEGGELPGHLPYIVQAIKPVIEQVKDQPGNLLEHAVRANAQTVADQLCYQETVLANYVAAGQLKIVPAYYDLACGHVELLT